MKHLLLLSAFTLLAGCASLGMGSNTERFMGQTYKSSMAELGREVSTFYFDNQQNPNHKIFVERNTKHPKDVNGKVFEQDWMQKEQQYRTQDCKIDQKQTAKTTYYTCKPTHAPKMVIYTFKADANNVYVKVWADANFNGQLSLGDEQKIADTLADFYLP